MIFQQSWESRGVLTDWKLANVPIFKKGRKEDPDSYMPVRLTSTLGKTVEVLILRDVENLLRDNAVIGYSQHGFMRGKFCLTNLIL